MISQKWINRSRRSKNRLQINTIKTIKIIMERGIISKWGVMRRS
jgi:hypothetical protein